MTHDPLCNTFIGLSCNCSGRPPHTHAPGLRKAFAGNTIPTDSAERKNIPMATGLLDYFPAALAEVARLSKAANDKHNPGEDMHWSRGKSADHADTIIRHLVERGTLDTDGFYHDVKVAWRALAALEELLEEKNGLPMSRASRLAQSVPERDA